MQGLGGTTGDSFSSLNPLVTYVPGSTYTDQEVAIKAASYFASGGGNAAYQELLSFEATMTEAFTALAAILKSLFNGLASANQGQGGSVGVLE